MDPSNFQLFMDALPNRMEQQQARAATTNELLLQVAQEQRSARQDNQKFQQQSVFDQRLLKWTDRQEKFNTIFLDEIRDIKADVRGLKQEGLTTLGVTIKQHETRLTRLEDFMDGFLRKAG